MGTRLDDLFPIALLEEMIADRFVRRFEHANGDLLGYVYTERTQWERVWNPCTRQCRGIIADSDGNVLARPFPKFFNLGDDPETDAIYHGQPFQLREKLDGSLGIGFVWEGEHHIATKGAFHSEQAIWATDEIRRVGGAPDAADVTYLFEIIRPENRIVVDYRDRAELVFLDALQVSDGARVRREWAHVAQTFDIPPDATAAQLRGLFSEMDTGNFEGFVAVYDDGHRVKIKLSEYLRLHRILSRTSNRSIWEALASGQDPRDSQAAIPDEFHDWVSQTIDRLNSEFQAAESNYKQLFEQIRNTLPDRRAFAAHATKAADPSILFSMADDKDYTDAIWRMVRPETVEYPPGHL